MVRNRIKHRLVGGLQGNTLNTIPYQDEKPELIQLNKALSKADTRHDIPVHIGPGFFTTILNSVYQERIDIIEGPPVVSYRDSTPSNDIFTNAIKSQVSSYNLNSVNFNFEGNPYVYALHSLSGPIPKHSSIPYFMQRLETGIELIREGETKVVVVSDNASLASVHREILKNQSQIFLRNVNPPPPERPTIEETVTLASIIDMAGKSVPTNWAALFHKWWDECVGEEVNSFNINLTAIGAVNMDGTGLIISRRAIPAMRGAHDAHDYGSLEVGIVVEGRAPITISYDLNQQSLEQSIVRNTSGEYIFVSGKNIAKVFFEEYNKVLNGGTDRIAPRTQHFLNMVVNAVSEATRINVDLATPVSAIFHTLGDDYNLIGKYFIVGKLIGDLLCPLCCDDKWYTLTNDNLMIARCLLLSKRALFYKKNKLFTGFYFFVPQEQPDVVAREVQEFQLESNARARELQAQAAELQAQAAELQARAAAQADQNAQAQAQALQAQAQAAEAETERVRTRSQTAAAQALQEAVTLRNQELSHRIRQDEPSIRQLEILVEKKIKIINSLVGKDILIRKTFRELKIDKMHKIYCEEKINEAFLQFSEDKITIEEAIDNIKRISQLKTTEKRHQAFLEGLIKRLERELGPNFLSGGAPKPTITVKLTVKWNKEVFENIPVDLSAPVSKLKVQLFSLTGVAPEKQKVIMGGKTLKDEMSLESYGVKNGSVLQMMGNASEMWVKPVMKEVTFVDDLPASEQATDNSQYSSEKSRNICGGYANVVIQDFKSDMINKIEEILKGNNEKRNFIFGVGNQPIIRVRHEAENFFQSLKSFLEKVIEKIESKDNLFILQIFGDVISHLEDILSITIPIIFQSNGDIIIPFCTDYNKVSHVCVLLGINIEDFKIKDESFEKQFDNFKVLFPNVSERILPIADIPTIVNNLVTSILEKIKNNEVILKEALPDIYGLLKGDNLETILSSNKDNINNLYFNVIPEVLGIMHSYGVFTEAEEVEFYIIQAIIGNENPNEHAIITKSIYSLYQNITVLYGIYVYDAEILKTFIENIKLKNNMIQYDGGFNSLQTIMDYRNHVRY